MSDIYAAVDGSEHGNGSQSMPYDLDNAIAAQTASDRVILLPGVYEQAVVVGISGAQIEGHFTGRPIIYGGAQITGTWSLHSGYVWKVTTTTPLASGLGYGGLILRTHSNVMIKGEYMDSLVEVVDDYQWFYTGGVLYLYSSGGDPTIAFWRVDKASLDGTASSILAAATGGLYIGDSIDDVDIENIAVRAFRGNGLLGDNAANLTLLNCDFSYNCGDGEGGFALAGHTLRDSTCNWNGTRRVRLGELGAADGDGSSLHAGSGRESTGFLVANCTFEGNCKDAVQNIDASTGTIENCTITNCGFGLVGNTTSGTTNYRNLIVRAGDLGVGGFGQVQGTHVISNCTFIGREQASAYAMLSVYGLGSVTVKNCIVTDFANGAIMAATTFVHTYNCWDVDTLGFTLSTGEIQSQPDILGSRFGLADSSPCLGTGTDLSASFTNDRYGRGRVTPWSMGAVEVVGITPRGRVLEALCVALEGIGDTSRDWQTVDAVTRVVRAGRNAEGVVAPFIETTSVSETYERVSATGIYARVLTVGFAYVLSDWDAFDWLGAIAHDVELAVGHDRTLGGVCDDATFTNNTSRIDGTDAAVSFTVELRFRTQDTAPMTRV